MYTLSIFVLKYNYYQMVNSYISEASINKKIKKKKSGPNLKTMPRYKNILVRKCLTV